MKYCQFCLHCRIRFCRRTDYETPTRHVPIKMLLVPATCIYTLHVCQRINGCLSLQAKRASTTQDYAIVRKLAISPDFAIHHATRNGGARHVLWGLSLQMGRLAPTRKHTGQESGGTLCEIFKFSMFLVVKICKHANCFGFWGTFVPRPTQL